jgi:hypothetical protein
MSFQTSHSGNMVVTHLTEGGERMHQNLFGCLPARFADRWMRVASKGSAVQR